MTKPSHVFPTSGATVTGDANRFRPFQTSSCFWKKHSYDISLFPLIEGGPLVHFGRLDIGVCDHTASTGIIELPDECPSQPGQGDDRVAGIQPEMFFLSVVLYVFLIIGSLHGGDPRLHIEEIFMNIRIVMRTCSFQRLHLPFCLKV